MKGFGKKRDCMQVEILGMVMRESRYLLRFIMLVEFGFVGIEEYFKQKGQYE